MRYNISFFENGTTPIIEVVQGDSARVLEFEPTDYEIPSGAVATYYIKRPSDVPVYNSATIEDNVVTVELTAEGLAEAGGNLLQVRLERNSKYLTSFSVVLVVRAFGGIGAVESHSESNIFDDTIDEAKDEILAVAGDVVRYDVAQTKTEAEKARARTNMGVLALTATDNDGNVVLSLE